MPSFLFDFSRTEIVFRFRDRDNNAIATIISNPQRFAPSG
jgi:hypothetical protein